MNRHLDRDLTHWEAGELTDDELRRRHPDEVGAIVAVHRQLSALRNTPTPDPAIAWAALAPVLPARDTATARPRRSRPRRAVVAAAIASVLAVPTVAYAAAPDAVRSVAREVRDLLPGTNNDGDHNDNDADPSTTTVTTTPPSPITDGSRGDESEQLDDNDRNTSGPDSQGPDTQGPDTANDPGADVVVDVGTTDNGTSSN